jgi:uncharacterized protein
MKRLMLVFMTGLTLSGCDQATPSAATQATAGDPAVIVTDYGVGDRLPKGKARDAAPARFREISWDDLIPKDWDPMQVFRGIDLDKLKDSDPRAMEALVRMKEAWNNAPVNPDLKGEAIRIPGFLVPLERTGEEVREFLLVPYFGACIHVPPPPSNQIIHVIPDKPVKGGRTMDAVWASGVLDTVRMETRWGNSGYRLEAQQVTPYEQPAK